MTSNVIGLTESDYQALNPSLLLSQEWLSDICLKYNAKPSEVVTIFNGFVSDFGFVGDMAQLQKHSREATIQQLEYRLSMRS